MDPTEIVGLVSVALPALLALASVVTRFTKTPKDDEVVRKALAILSVLNPGDAGGGLKLPGSRPRQPAPEDEPLIR